MPVAPECALKASNLEWVRLWGLAGFPTGGPFERFERRRLVDVHEQIELIGQAGKEIVTESFGLGPIDHPNRPLQTWLSKLIELVTLPS